MWRSVSGSQYIIQTIVLTTFMHDEDGCHKYSTASKLDILRDPRKNYNDELIFKLKNRKQEDCDSLLQMSRAVKLGVRVVYTA